MAVFELKSERGVSVGVGRGRLGLAEMKEGAALLWQALEGPDARVLWDFRDAVFDLETGGVQSLAEFVKQNSPLTGLRMAFLVSRDLEFGLIRMFDVFRQTSDVRTSVFRDESEAFAWLAADGD